MFGSACLLRGQSATRRDARLAPRRRIWSRIGAAVLPRIGGRENAACSARSTHRERKVAMIHIENVSRRGFLKGMVGTSAFVLGVTLAPKSLFTKSSVAGGDVLAGSGTNVLAADAVAPMSKAALQ